MTVDSTEIFLAVETYKMLDFEDMSKKEELYVRSCGGDVSP